MGFKVKMFMHFFINIELKNDLISSKMVLVLLQRGGEEIYAEELKWPLAYMKIKKWCICATRGLHIFMIFFVNNIMLFGVMYFPCIEEKNESFFLNREDFDFLRKYKIPFSWGNKNQHKLKFSCCTNKSKWGDFVLLNFEIING